MDLKLQRRVLNIEWEEKKYLVTFPTYKQSQEFSREMEGKTDEKKSELLLSYLGKLGLPVGVSETMEAEHIKQVSEMLAGVKKK